MKRTDFEQSSVAVAPEEAPDIESAKVEVQEVVDTVKEEVVEDVKEEAKKED